MNSRFKTFAKNIILFGICSLCTKLMAYIILPLYTETVSTEEYGLIDLIIVTTNLILPIFTMCISDWVLRQSSDNNSDKKKIFSIALTIVLIGTILVGLLVPILFFTNVFRLNAIYILIGFITISLNQLLICFLKAIDKSRIFTISGLVGAAFTIDFNLIFYKYFYLNVRTYFIFQYAGTFLSFFIAFFASRSYRYIGKTTVTKNEKKEIINYCLPLIPNSLFWWVNSSLDKYCIILIIGMNMSGIYGAASKIPSLLTIFAEIFQQAWSVFLYKETDSERSKQGSKIFKYYHFFLLIGAVALILFCRVVSNILLKGDFISGWSIVPLLVIAFLFTTMSTFLGSFFTAHKNTKPLFISSLISGVVNLSLNIVLIYFLGIVGAALATVVSSCTNFIIRLFISVKLQYIVVNKIRFFVFVPIYFLLITNSIMLALFANVFVNLLVCCSLLFGLAIILLTYLRERKRENGIS